MRHHGTIIGVLLSALILGACGNTPDRRIDTIPDPYRKSSTTTSTAIAAPQPDSSNGETALPEDSLDSGKQSKTSRRNNGAGIALPSGTDDPSTIRLPGSSGSGSSGSTLQQPTESDDSQQQASTDDPRLFIPLLSPSLAVTLNPVPPHTCTYFNRVIDLGNQLYYGEITDLDKYKSITSEMVEAFTELGKGMPAPYTAIYSQFNDLVQNLGRQTQNATSIGQARDLLGYVAERMAPMIKRIMELHPTNCAAAGGATTSSGR